MINSEMQHYLKSPHISPKGSSAFLAVEVVVEEKVEPNRSLDGVLPALCCEFAHPKPSGPQILLAWAVVAAWLVKQQMARSMPQTFEGCCAANAGGDCCVCAFHPDCTPHMPVPFVPAIEVG